jgi:hypothetical protein
LTIDYKKSIMATYELETEHRKDCFLAFLKPRLGAAALASAGGGRARLMVFVHGGHGHFIKTWTNRDTKAYWPKLVRDDTANFGSMDVAMFDYFSPILTEAPGVQETANILRELLTEQRSADYDDIVFVPHSLGGVVTRQLLVDLEKDKDPLLGKTRLVASMTCAYGGSIVPKLLCALGSQNGQFRDVKTGSNYLKKLNARWEALRQTLSPQQRHRPFVWSVRGESDKLITREHAELGSDAVSARGANPEVLFPKRLRQARPDSRYVLGHSDIVKPDNSDHAAHQALRIAFRLAVSDG